MNEPLIPGKVCYFQHKKSKKLSKAKIVKIIHKELVQIRFEYNTSLFISVHPKKLYASEREARLELL